MFLVWVASGVTRLTQIDIWRERERSSESPAAAAFFCSVPSRGDNYSKKLFDQREDSFKRKKEDSITRDITISSYEFGDFEIAELKLFYYYGSQTPTMVGGTDNRTPLPLVMVATAAATAAATYLVVKRQFANKIAEERREKYASDRAERVQLQEERKLKSLPSGTKLR